MGYIEHLAILILLYTTLTVSLDLVIGHAGLLSVSHAAFFGIGAYTSALMSLRWGTPFLAGTVTGMMIAATSSLLASMPSARLRGDYFVLALFCFQMIVFSMMENWVQLTRGTLGLAGIPQPDVFGWTVDGSWGFIALAGVFAMIAYLIVAFIVASPFGRVLYAIREDENFGKACGKATFRYKIAAFAVSSALAAAAGSLYAHYFSYVDPMSFTVMESILILTMIIIGGAGSMWGPLVGAVVLVTLPEALRFVGLPTATAANLRQIIYGALLVVMMMARPQGLVGRYAFGR